jgi:hypothetical protein
MANGNISHLFAEIQRASLPRRGLSRAGENPLQLEARLRTILAQSGALRCRFSPATISRASLSVLSFVLNPNLKIMKPFKHMFAVLACAALLLGQFGCQTAGTLLSSTQFSDTAYNTDKRLKADSLALIDRAKNKTPYKSVDEDVNGLMNKIDATIATEQQRTKNAPTVAQWKKIKAQLTTLFNMWKTKGTLSPGFVDEARQQVTTLFDILINTENDKRARS